MSDRPTLPYGLWTSPLDPVELAQAKRLRDVRWDSDGKTLVWLEVHAACLSVSKATTPRAI